MEGGLGAGKTTLVRGLVENLPGSGEAEPGSPSFNIFNLYPTTPEVAHFDLYRLEGEEAPEELEESLLDSSRLTVVEWAQHLKGLETLDNALVIEFSGDTGERRRVTFRSRGPHSSRLLDRLAALTGNEPGAGMTREREEM